MTPKVCILNEDDARSLTYGGIAHQCNSRRHHHYGRKKAEEMVKAGELVWLGKHKKIATFRNARSWIKTYQRNQYGEVISCGMQLVRGGGGF
jgi:predicted GIY-YIG superfamily endonuclease